MKILGASASSDQWNISLEKENAKHTVARVTAFRKDQDPDQNTSNNSNKNNNSDDNSGSSNKLVLFLCCIFL